MDPRLSILKLDVATTFRLDEAGRILCENDPDGSPGPRAFVAGCAAGNIVHLRADVAQGTAAEIAALVAAEPPWIDPRAGPGCADEIVRILGAPPARIEVGLNYALARQALPAGRFVCGNTAQGDALLANLRGVGMPAHLVAAGFVSVDDFWPPWCVAMEDEVVAAIAFSARLAPASAAVGVYTFPEFRRRGLAAAATARWTTLPGLGPRSLFYGTSETNLSSQRVAARLGLERVGLGLRIT